MFKTLKRKIAGASDSSGLNSRNSLAPPPSQFGSLLAPPPSQFGSVLAPTLRQARSFNDLVALGSDTEDKVCGGGGGCGRGELWEGAVGEESLVGSSGVSKAVERGESGDWGWEEAVKACLAGGLL